MPLDPNDPLTAHLVTRRPPQPPFPRPRPQRSREGTVVKRISGRKEGVVDGGARSVDWPLVDAETHTSCGFGAASIGGRSTSYGRWFGRRGRPRPPIHPASVHAPPPTPERRRQTTLALIATGFPRMAAAAGPSIAQSGRLRGRQSPVMPYALPGLRALERVLRELRSGIRWDPKRPGCAGRTECVVGDCSQIPYDTLCRASPRRSSSWLIYRA
jgi:hypothetical protein